MKIILLSLDSLGDLVLREPLVQGLLDQGYEVTLVLRQSSVVLVPYLDSRIRIIATEIFPYSPPEAATWLKAHELLQQILDFGADAIVAALFNRTYLDDWLLGQLKDLTRYGFQGLPESARDPDQKELYLRFSISADSTELLTHAERAATELSEFSKNHLLLELILNTAGATRPVDSSPCRPLPKLNLPIALSMKGEEVLKGLSHDMALRAGQFVLGCPTGIENVGIKAWPESNFIEVLCATYQKHRLPFLLTGSSKEETSLRRIQELGMSKGIPVHIWVGLPADFGILLALIQLGRYYLGSDSGPMHFAAALGKPVVALFGGGTWPRFVPAARRAYVVAKALPCTGCLWNCCFKEPVCLSETEVSIITDGIDWILGNDPDEVRIMTHTPGIHELTQLVQAGQKHYYESKRQARLNLAAAEHQFQVKLKDIEELTEGHL